MTTDTVGGVWTYALELADALAEHDVEITLAAMGAPLSPDQRAALGRAARRAARSPSDYALEWMEDPWDDVERAGALAARDRGRGRARRRAPERLRARRRCRGGAPVVVAGTPTCSPGGAPCAASRAGRSGTATREGVARRASRPPTSSSRRRRRCSTSSSRLYGPPCPRQVIPNGASRAACPLGAEGAARARRRAHVGRGEERRGARPGRAAAAVAGRRRGDRRGRTTACARSGPLGRAAMDAVAARRASIYAEPARYEPFGLAALEAARAGCALVLGDIPSLREVWGDAALYVAAATTTTRSSGRSARCVERPRAPATSTRPGPNGGLARYSAARMAAAYVDAYRRVRHEPGGGRRREGRRCSATRSSRTGTTATPTSSAASRASSSRAGTTCAIFEPRDGWSRAEPRRRARRGAARRVPARVPRAAQHALRPRRRSTSTRRWTARRSCSSTSGTTRGSCAGSGAPRAAAAASACSSTTRTTAR